MSHIVFSIWQSDLIDNRSKNENELHNSTFQLPHENISQRESMVLVGWNGVAVYDLGVEDIEEDIFEELPVCYLTKASPIESCRICIVEVESIGVTVPSCHERSKTMELYGINHPYGYGVCDKGRECDFRIVKIEPNAYNMVLGDVVTVCTARAQVDSNYKYGTNTWGLTKVPTTCSFYGEGCQIYYETKNDKIYRVTNEYVCDAVCSESRFNFAFEIGVS